MTPPDPSLKHRPQISTSAAPSLQQRPAVLLTAADVAALLQVSVRTVRRLIAAGTLNVVRVGRSVRVDPVTLQIMLSAKRQKRT